MADTKPKTLPPYISYKAFTRFLGQLRDSHLPSRVDRGVLSGMSGSGQSTMLSSLETLGLIEKDGKPTEAFRQLVGTSPTSEEYKALLRSVLHRTYPYLFGGTIDLQTTTTNEVQEVVRMQGVSGSTVAKVIAFFLSAAKDAGVEVSKYVRTPPITEVGVKKRQSANRGDIASALAQADEDSLEEEMRQGSGIDLHPALLGVLQTLPAPGQPMTDTARSRFLRAFEAVLVLAHPSSDEPV